MLNSYCLTFLCCSFISNPMSCIHVTSLGSFRYCVSSYSAAAQLGVSRSNPDKLPNNFFIHIPLLNISDFMRLYVYLICNIRTFSSSLASHGATQRDRFFAWVIGHSNQFMIISHAIIWFHWRKKGVWKFFFGSLVRFLLNVIITYTEVRQRADNNIASFVNSLNRFLFSFAEEQLRRQQQQEQFRSKSSQPRARSESRHRQPTSKPPSRSCAS